MLQVLKGCFAMLAYKPQHVQGARDALAAAEPALARATERERAARRRAGAPGPKDEMDRALAIWEQILADHPRDVLAFRLHHFCAFWLGRPERDADGGGGRAAALVGDRAGLGQRCWPAAPSPTRNAATTSWRRHAGRAAVDARPRRPLGGARRRACAGDAGPPRRGHRLAHRAGAALGRRQQPACTICGGTARCTTWSGGEFDAGAGALRPRLPQPAEPGDAGACRISTSTCRTRPPCCSGWSATASMSATAGSSWPTRRRRGSATACPPSPCRTG